MRKAKLFGLCLLLGLASSAQAAGIECPETGKGAIAVSPSETRLLEAGSDVDLANEIGELLVTLRAQRPDITYGGLTNEALAVYCPIIANAPSLDARQKLDRLRKFDALLRERLSSEIAPQESSILAQVPLSLATYRALREKADDAGQTPSQYMTALLTKAAGEAKGQ